MTAVEVDPALADALRAARDPQPHRRRTPTRSRSDLAALAPPGTRLVGNLPYFISSPLLRRFLDLRGRVTDAHVMLQEEVARRVASPPGSKEYGILSVLFALWADVTIVLRFPPGAFQPPPKVHSAVIRIRFRDEPARPAGPTRRPSPPWSPGPLPSGGERLKTTCKIAILTSRNT